MNLNRLKVLKIIDNGLAEDIGTGDITTELLFDNSKKAQAVMIAKGKGVIAGLDVASLVFKRVDSKLKFEKLVQDGKKVEAGTEIVKLSGLAASILMGERLALNFLQRMSGIATKTNYYSELIKNYDVKVVDTRKTTPGLRILEKYAVKAGGGFNHRYGLYDAVMIKDNHIKASGGIKKAIKKVKKNLSHTMKVEVEVESLEEVKEALEVKADIIMLDNMSNDEMKEAVKMIAGMAIVEASGGITDRNIIEVAKSGVDVISLGTLTHTIRSLDISLNFEEGMNC